MTYHRINISVLLL